jgi:hypothetical protein
MVVNTVLCAQTPKKSVATSRPSDQTNLSSTEDLNIQAYVQLLRTDLNKTRSQIMGSMMQLDARQAAAFWPVYKDFQDDYGKIGDQIVDLIKEYTMNYDTMTDELAEKLALKLLDIHQQRVDLKKQVFGRLKTALDPITAARFLQIENQLENLIDLQIASQLPVVGGSGR